MRELCLSTRFPSAGVGFYPVKGWTLQPFWGFLSFFLKKKIMQVSFFSLSLVFFLFSVSFLLFFGFLHSHIRKSWHPSNYLFNPIIENLKSPLRYHVKGVNYSGINLSFAAINLFVLPFKFCLLVPNFQCGWSLCLLNETLVEVCVFLYYHYSCSTQPKTLSMCVQSQIEKSSTNIRVCKRN